MGRCVTGHSRSRVLVFFSFFSNRRGVLSTYNSCLLQTQVRTLSCLILARGKILDASLILLVDI